MARLRRHLPSMLGWLRCLTIAGLAFHITGQAAGPKIQFAQTTWDWGKAESGETVKYSFCFTNVGDQLLEVREVATTCGCTTTGQWDKQVAPGKSGTIPVEFHSSGYSGSVQKSITVLCNDPANSTVGLYITGIVWKALEVSPAYAVFNFGPDAQTNETRVLRLMSNIQEPVTVSKPVCANPSFKAAIKTLKPDKEYELRVTVLAPLARAVESAVVTLQTSYPKLPTLNVSAYASVQPAVSLMPPSLTLPSGLLTNAVQLVCLVRNNSTNSLVLTQPAINVPGVELQLKEIQPGRQFELALKFHAGFQAPPGTAIEARVKSNDPRVPELKLPIYQMSPISSMPAPSPIPPPVPTPDVLNRTGS